MSIFYVTVYNMTPCTEKQNHTFLTHVRAHLWLPLAFPAAKFVETKTLSSKEGKLIRRQFLEGHDLLPVEVAAVHPLIGQTVNEYKTIIVEPIVLCGEAVLYSGTSE